MKKICIFITTFVIIFLLNSNIVLADSSVPKDVLPDFNTYVVQDDGTEKSYYVRCDGYHSDNRKYYLFILSEPWHPDEIYNGAYYSKAANIPTSVTCSLYTYDINTSTNWEHYSTGPFRDAISNTFGVPLNDYTSGTDQILLYSNYDITYQGNVVFQRPHSLPIMVQKIPTTIRMGVMSQLHYLLPLLLSLVIGLMAFRKAWNWLRIQFF